MPAQASREPGHDQFAAFANIGREPRYFVAGEDARIRQENDWELPEAQSSRVLIEEHSPRNMFVEHRLLCAVETLEVTRGFLATLPIPRPAAEINPHLPHRRL